MTFAPVHIIVPGAIQAWKRAQRRLFKNGFSTTFTDPKVEAYHAVVRMAADKAMNGQPPFEGAIELTLLAVYPVPRSWSGKRELMALQGLIQKTSRPDLENSIKGALDAMQTVVYQDDSQIVNYAGCRKVYGDRPRLEILVMPAGRLTDAPLVVPDRNREAVGAVASQLGQGPPLFAAPPK